MLKSLSNQFLTLLKAGLWGSRIDDLSLFKLSTEEWEYIYEFSKAQTVDGIVFDGVLGLPEVCLPPKPILYRWAARIDAIERVNNDMRNVMSEVVNVFQKSGVQPVLLKGFGLAENYIKPEFRINGDIDLYFDNMSHFNKMNEFLISKNVKVEKGDHESVFYHYKGVEFEHHTKFIDLFNPFLKDKLNNLYKQECNKFEYLKVGEGQVLVPSYLIMQIQTNAHILKHFLGFGIGLRQFCDVAMLCSKQPKTFNGKVLLSSFESLKIDKWMNLVYSFLVNHLGLPINKLPYSIKLIKDTDWLLNEIMQGGNFGFYYQTDKNKNKVRREIKRSNSLKRILPHILKAYRYVPSEAFWYPIMKITTKIRS